MGGSRLTIDRSSYHTSWDARQTLRRMILTTILLVSITVNLFPQFAIDSLRITDAADRTPISNVHIYLNDSLIGITDTNGTYRSSVPFNQNDSLSCTCIGYQKKKFSLIEAQRNRFHITLIQDITSISEIDIFGKKQELKPYIQYTQLASLPQETHSFASVLYNDTIYVHGGMKSNFTKDQHFITSTLYKYSIHDDEWLTERKNFKKRASHALHVYNDKLYILGGQTYLNDINRTYLENSIEIYDIHTGQLTIDSINLHPAINFASFLEDHYLIMMGGTKQIKTDVRLPYSEKRVFTNEILVSDLKTGKWYKMGETNEAKESTGVLIDNKIYLIGGHSFKRLDTIESYDLVTKQTAIESQLKHEADRPAVASDGLLIYIFNKGLIYTFNTATKETKAYAIDLAMEDATLHCNNGKLYILGGILDKGVLGGMADNEVSGGAMKITDFAKSQREDRVSRSLYCINITEFEKTANIYNSLIH